MEKGDLWAALSNNGQDKSFNNLLDYDKTLGMQNAIFLDITNGRVEVHPDAARILLALGIVDRRDMKRSDPKFALLVANALFEAKMMSADKLATDIASTVNQTSEKIIKNEGRFKTHLIRFIRFKYLDHVMQGNQWVDTPWAPQAYKSAFINGKLH